MRLQYQTFWPLFSNSGLSTQKLVLFLIRSPVIGHLPWWPLYTTAEHRWTWPLAPRPQLHQEPPNVTVVMRWWDLWQMNKSNLSVADRGDIDLSGVMAECCWWHVFPSICVWPLTLRRDQWVRFGGAGPARWATRRTRCYVGFELCACVLGSLRFILFSRDCSLKG